MKIVEQEAERLEIGRGNFLTMLVKREQGMAKFERPADAPAHFVKKADLEKIQPYSWYVTPATRDWVDGERLRMGMGITTYMIFQINRWLGNARGPELRAER